MVIREQELKKLYENLYDVSLLGAQFVAITGPRGIGKSTFLRYYIQNLPEWATGILIKYTPSKADFVNQLKRFLHTHEDTPESILLSFYQYLSSLRKPLVLAIDDVDFSSKFLGMIFENLKIYMVQVVVTSEDENHPDEFEKISLKPWGKEEIKKFYREITGYEPDIETIIDMEEKTRGIPDLCRKYIKGIPLSSQTVDSEDEEKDPKKVLEELYSRGLYKKAYVILKKLLNEETSPVEREKLKLEIVKNWATPPEECRRILDTVDTRYLSEEAMREYILLQGYVSYRLLDFESAHAIFDKFIRQFPDSPEYMNAVLLRGESSYYLGKIREAERDFKIVTGASNDELKFMAYRGLFLTNRYRLRYDEAMDSIRRMESIASSLKNYNFIQIALTLKAGLLTDIGKIKEAQWLFYKAIKMSREIDIYFYFPLESLHLYTVTLDFKNAIHQINHMLNTRPPIDKLIHALLHLHLSKALVEIDRIDEAAHHLEIFEKLMPSKHAWEVVSNRIRLYIMLKKGMLPEALELLKKLSAPRNTSSDIMNRIVKYTIYYLQGKTSLAEKKFLSLIKFLKSRNAYSLLVYASFKASKLFPRNRTFTQFLPARDEFRKTMGIYLLGPFKVTDNESKEVFSDYLKSAKLREFIGILGLSRILTRDGKLSRHLIKEKLWPYFNEERQNKNLSWVISRFREIFGKNSLKRIGDFISLNREAVYLDVDEFLEYYEIAKDSDTKGVPLKALDYYKKALSLVSGKPFEGIPIQSSENAYQSLMGMVENSFIRICEIYAEINEPRELRHWAGFARNIFPFNERFYQFTVQSYLMEGNKLKARKELERLQEIYKRELGEPFPFEI